MNSPYQNEPHFKNVADAARRLAYAQGQFEIYKARMLLRHACMITEPEKAEQHAEAMRRHIEFMDDCNDFQDKCIEYINTSNEAERLSKIIPSLQK